MQSLRIKIQNYGICFAPEGNQFAMVNPNREMVLYDATVKKIINN